MQKTRDAISKRDLLTIDPNGLVHKFGEGYELWLEPLIFDGQWYMALYKDKELLIPKVAVKIGKL